MLFEFLIFIGVLSLLIGSFLNVVIARLPVIIFSPAQSQSFNLAFPASHCPKCQHPIAWYENIPVLSYLFLKGQCHYCHQPISFRYPMVELLTMILSLFVAFHFGISLKTVGGLLLVWTLIPLSFIDFDHTILPDDITIPCLWLGLFFNIFHVFTDPSSAIIGAIAGYLSLWFIYILFKAITGKEGIGFGDFKLLAMLGAWLGWKMLPFIILISSSLGTIVGLLLIILRGRDKNVPIPFGPFLAIGGGCALLWDRYLNQWYFQWMGVIS